MNIAANWIWRNHTESIYNDIIVAKRNFIVSGKVQKAVISVTADSFYRLFINNQWVCDGPARGWPEHYYYDQPDVTNYLQNGENEIKIIANYYGTGLFHSIPQRPGLLLQLDIEYKAGSFERVVTDNSWLIAKASGWESNTPKISCQMEPAEFYNACNEDDLHFEPAAILCKVNEGPWKYLKVRDVKMLTKKPIKFRHFSNANILKSYNSANTFCCSWTKLIYPGLIQANRKIIPAFGLVTVIESDVDLELEIDVSDYRQGIYDIHIDSNQITEKTTLAAGQHLLFITSGVNCNHTTDITIRISSDKQFNLVNPYNSKTDNVWTMLEFEEFKCAENDIAWTKQTKQFQAAKTGYLKKTKELAAIADISEFISQTSQRVMGLDSDEMFVKDNYHRFITRRQVKDADSNVHNPEGILSDNNREVTVYPSVHGDVELIYDIGEQGIGYYSFELEAEEGVEIDIYAVEYINPEGKIQFPDEHRNGMTYVTKAGINRFTSLKRRAGRYVFIRFSNKNKPISIKEIKLIESTYPVEYKCSFQCSDESLNKIWEISARTLKLCMEDTFTDCPLYEQTLWVGDARNESKFAYGTFGSTDIAKRCIILAAQSLERFPLVGCQVPSSWHCILPAWSFLWGISVWDYYWYTKDKNFLAEMWHYIMKNLKGAADYINEDGLFSGDFWNLFDWADIDQDHQTVLHSNMFLVGAVNAAFKCGEVLEKTDELKWLKELRDKLKSSINNQWQKSKRSYPDSIHENGTASDSISQHTSFLALLYDIAEPDMKEILIKNITAPPEEMVKVGSPFAIFFMYEMLDKFGMWDSILDSIKKSYLPMVESDASTVWESFAAGTLAKDDFPTRSHCHAWSSAPLYFFSRIILGIKQTSPGCETFEISPNPTNLNWAKGSFATPRGVLKVSWKKEVDKIKVDYDAPKGVDIILKGDKLYFENQDL